MEQLKLKNMINKVKFLWEIWYLQSCVEKKRYILKATINEMNEQIDNIRKLNLIILEIKRIRTLDE